MNMKELIKEAESLYNQIDRIQLDIVKSRLDVCEERKWKAISEMETAMCAVFQFLKCIIDRKDNIVDLGEVWHKKEIKPEENSEIVVIAENGEWYNISYSYDDYDDSFGKGWSACVRLYDIVKWAYVEDLLPKGGELWNTTK